MFDVMSCFGKGSCWSLPRVFKPRQAAMRLSCSNIIILIRPVSVGGLG